MKRIYSNYTDEDYRLLTDLARELGFSLSAFQHYCVMLYADDRGNTDSSAALVSRMLKNLENTQVGSTFIVSALLPEVWPSLTRNMKMVLAKQLALYVRKNPERFAPHKISKGKTTIYKRIG